MRTLPKRKSPRLKDFDYSSPGAYFVTICVKNKLQLLSTITVGTGLLDCPQNTLSNYGQIADKYIRQIDAFYNHISVDKYVIMPNHVHMLIRIKDVGQSGRPVPTEDNGANSMIAKFVGTWKRFCNREYEKNIWQRSYHDHIIRSEKDYQKIWEYIDTNIQRWEKDCFYTN